MKQKHICLKVRLKMLLEQWCDDLLSLLAFVFVFPKVLAREGADFFPIGLNKFDMKFHIKD